LAAGEYVAIIFANGGSKIARLKRPIAHDSGEATKYDTDVANGSQLARQVAESSL